MKPETCPTCEKGEIRTFKGPGRTRPFRCVASLSVPDEFGIPTCTHCGDEFLPAKETLRLNAGLEEAFGRLTSLRLDESLALLAGDHRKRREIESAIGVSAGYLSRLTSGKEPSAPLTSLLMVLSSRADALDELKRLWTSGPKAVRTEVEHHTMIQQYTTAASAPVKTQLRHVVRTIEKGNPA